MSEPLPQPKTKVPWQTPLRGPFHMITGKSIFRDLETLEEAAEEFARMAMPPAGSETTSYLADRNGVIACGFIFPPGSREPVWIGVDAGFAALGEVDFLDPLEVTSAEISAKRRSHGESG